MDVVVLGVSGAVGGLLADLLVARGDTVRGLVRTAEQQDALRARGVETVVGDLATADADALRDLVAGADAVVFAAGSNGGAAAVTRAVDGEAVTTTLEACRRAGVSRFLLVSVLPESWRERDLDDEVELYFAVKKQADVAVTRSDLDWVVLRPALLTDDPGTGAVSLGPAELHGQVPRADVAAVVAALLAEPRVRRQILELDGGAVPVADAVRANVRGD
ncbi:NAD(P)-binding oxidoreductase [Nocardioides zeae]|uniref:NAD(P)-binding oxidoreductase n=1 Tax=Nocardioides imazamoxiresistens TaxID=3231893 RepID=A0ABU3PW56_9ACTN|nr:NAD(P)-binding oxidoreductase [Nocardioides zeae]MDT9593463.1 NAD(P)-binding oxidoreductase [Nocardioides zeae]